MKILCRSLSIFILLANFWSCSQPELPKEVATAMESLPEKVDYNIHVKPILSDRCFACHGPDENKVEAGLRLDNPDDYDNVSESGRKILVPGDLGDSELFHRIISNDPVMVMPTPESNLKLTAKEKAVLIKWIQQGAEYEKHWSFLPLEKPELPTVKDESWINNPIDNFVLAKLEEKDLKPNNQAPKETLIRRVSFDLTGLPPTIPEIDSFLADTSPNAYEKVVDRLLKSPHYGERMAVDWLDVARYADTHGYQDDGYRNSYPWRDWVISAFNENLPYDKFITWQLAGDLLPDANKEQIIATSFLRNHPQSQEGGIIPEEYRTEYVADRVNVFGQSMLALSTECARCHDHKYDPISQKNYFELFAFFNNNNESGEVPYKGEASPTLILTTPEVDKILTYINEGIEPLEEKENDRSLYQDGFEKWLAASTKKAEGMKLTDNGLLGRYSFDEKINKKGSGRPPRKNKNSKNKPIELSPMVSTGQGEMPAQVEGKYGKATRVAGDMGVVFERDFAFDRNQPFSFSVWVKTFEPGLHGPLFGKTAGDVNGWRGYMCELNENQTLAVKLTHVYPANGIELVSKNRLPLKQWNHLVLTYDGSSKAEGVKLFLNGSEFPLRVVNDHLKQSILHAKNNRNQGGGVRRFMLGREQRGSISNVAFDEFRVYDRPLSELEVRHLSGQKDLLSTLLAIPEAKRKAEQKNLLYEYYLLGFDKRYAGIQQQLTKKRGKKNDILTNQEEVMVYEELDKPRATYILDRGVYDAPTERVYPNTPESVLAYDEDLPKNRLGLAKWLLSEENPLFSRVVVNRFWQQFFGTGIVKTSDDFGNQGELPTHPELLDWLAIRFRENDWNVKEFLKMIVMSSTYRQNSIPTTENDTKDPDNRYLSRGPAFRMSAEMIRDNALAASGLLVRDVGGESVYPYQPPGVWEALAVRNDVHYDQGKGDDLYRRSLYTIWKRSSPHPAMSIFDVPDRYVCTIQRQKTSTPLQALVLMNDVQYVEAARVLAEKMVQHSTKPEEQITYAFRRLTSRYPREEEMGILLDLYKEEQANFSKNPKKAEKLLQVGEYKRQKDLPAQKVASCAIVAHTIMNFDEFIVKR